jgi:hypothetical protein
MSRTPSQPLRAFAGLLAAASFCLAGTTSAFAAVELSVPEAGAGAARVNNVFAAAPPQWSMALQSYVSPNLNVTPVVMLLQSQGFAVAAPAPGQEAVLMKEGRVVADGDAKAAAKKAQLGSYALVARAAESVAARAASESASPDELLDSAAKLRLLDTNGLGRYLTGEQRARFDSAAAAATSRLLVKEGSAETKVKERMKQIVAGLGSMREAPEDAVKGALPAARSSGLSPVSKRLPSPQARTTPAPAAPESDDYSPQIYDFERGIAVPEKDRTRLAKIAAEYGVADFDPADFAGLINAVARAKSNPQGWRDAARWPSWRELLSSPFSFLLRRRAATDAERMAQFAQAAEFSIAGMPDADQRALHFALANAVLLEERWRPSEFKQSFALFSDLGSGLVVHPAEYRRLIANYVDQTPLHKNIEYSGGILTVKTMRDLASHNLWPIFMRGHDILHVHYAVGHPRAAAVYFRSARSKNDLRFIMMGAMFEGVDTTQYGHESKLARYMAQTKGFDLEQAMIYIGMATDAELRRLARISSPGSVVGSARGWVPRQNAGAPVAGRTGRGLETEIDDMIREFEGAARNERFRRIANYSRDVPKGGAAESDDSIHHY